MCTAVGGTLESAEKLLVGTTHTHTHSAVIHILSSEVVLTWREQSLQCTSHLQDNKLFSIYVCTRKHKRVLLLASALLLCHLDVKGLVNVIIELYCIKATVSRSNTLHIHVGIAPFATTKEMLTLC